MARPMSVADLLKLKQAQDLLTANKPEQSLAMLQRMAAKDAANPDINALLAMATMRLGRLEQAEFFARRAAAGSPGNAANLNNLAMVLMGMGRKGEALECIERAIAVDPSYNEARLLKCNLLMDERHVSEMLRTCEEAMQYGWHPQVCVSYASAIASLGDADRAVAFLREARVRFPGEAYLAGLLPMAMTAQWGAKPEEVAAAHREYGALIDRIRPPFLASYQPVKDPEKKLRVALVSPDLRRHSVAYFIEPFLEHFDRDRFEVLCYSTNRTFDDVSARLKGLATLWRDMSSRIELQMGEQMSEDRVDIAIDLAGHTDGNSLLAFALRIAPVQVTYCGYPDTTGLAQMDWRIVDSCTDPRTPEVDARAVEQLYRMDPCFLCYRPPDPSPPPARDMAFPGPVFGSFNATRKHNAAIIALWSRLLHEVPGSRLVLKAMDLTDPDIRALVLARFTACGVNPQRVEFLDPPAGMMEHLALYSRIDVALDPMPYQGTTTTCEALWMGVPVVTMAGVMHAGRVGVSLLNSVGAPELIARDADDYVNIAAALCRDQSRLAAYRSTLRPRMLESPLMDRAGFARQMGEGLREMWRDYCHA